MGRALSEGTVFRVSPAGMGLLPLHSEVWSICDDSRRARDARRVGYR